MKKQVYLFTFLFFINIVSKAIEQPTITSNYSLKDYPNGYYIQNLIFKFIESLHIKDKSILSLQEKPTENFKIIDINVKILDKQMRQVKDSLYASKFELSNMEYWFFLDYLYQNNYKELYDKCKVDISKYDDLHKAFLGDYHYSPTNMELLRTPKVKTNFFQNYPAIDMTYEASKTYCEWLTTQYNQQENRKFKKVRFRLPTQKEWTMMALGYEDFTSWNLKENVIEFYKRKSKELKKYYLKDYNILYPWDISEIYEGGDLKSRLGKITNPLGCYLANVKSSDEICYNGLKGDGFTFTAPIASFFPNNMFFSEVIGNVAEMIDEDGKAMGGSWNHLPEECTITSVSHYRGSDTTVGFRLFMEVIEE